MYSEAFVFGLLVPAGSLYLLLSAELPWVSDVILLPWLAITMFGAVLLCTARQVQPDAILGGGIFGVICGWLALMLITGSDFIILILGFVAIGAIAAGALLLLPLARKFSLNNRLITGLAAAVILLLVSIILGLAITG